MLEFISIALALFILWTIINILSMPRLSNNSGQEFSPFVSILIPMRNEERNIESLIASLQALTYKNMEIMLLDDQSTDQTASFVQQAIKDDSRFRLLHGKPLPDEWVGKVHACFQLEKEAKGDYLLFIDADVRLKPSCIEHSLHTMQKHNAALLTGFPAFSVPPLLAKLLVPMQHFVVLFHLPVIISNKTLTPQTTAAHGAFLFFERESYEQIGGHTAVKSSLVEDVAIARRMKECGFRVVLANITKDVSCTMYESNREVWEGFLKNIFNGIGRSYPIVILLTCFYSFFYILPLIWLLYGTFTQQWVYLLPYVLTVLQRLLVDLSVQQRWYLSLLMPFSALSLLCLLYASMIKKSHQWKGRSYL